MSEESVRSRLVATCRQIEAGRTQELKRAIEFQNDGDPRQACYHTGLADGNNEAIKTLKAIIDGLSKNERGQYAFPKDGRRQ